MKIPAALAWWREEPGGPEWLERLPALVAECAEEWGLTLGSPVEDAHVSLVVPATLADGEGAVLKVNFPEPESEREPDALAFWNGRGAVRLLAHDRARRTLLVERCTPGTQLWAVEDEAKANRIAAGVLRRLWRPPAPGHPFRLLADEAGRWAEELPRRWSEHGRPYERALLEEAVAFLRDAAHGSGEAILLHQDFHGGNVLRARREPWLAVDPKPLVGERAFDTASLLRDRRQELARDSHPGRTVRRRLDELSAELGLERGRMRAWGIAHALAWDPDEGMIACARWLAAAR